MNRLADDCFIHDRDRLRHEEALALLKDRLSCIAQTAQVAVEDAHQRILRESIAAPRNIPAFDNSAVDGFAFAFDDHEPTGGYFPVSQRVAAGDQPSGELPGFSAARIFTGAVMPPGADTIAMQEDCETVVDGARHFVRIPAGLKRGANCRRAGEDVEAGQVIAEAGQRLRPQDLAAIASAGVARVTVSSPLRIALLSSGNEILRPGEPFRPGAVYDANHVMLQSMIDEPGFAVSDLGVCPDDLESVKALLKSASRDHDVIISTGGASRGEEDHFVNAVTGLGSCHLWQLAVKPGRPMSFGQIGSTPCLTLPGNPVAAFVCYLLYVRPALFRLAGAAWYTARGFTLPAGFRIRSKPDRREFLRGFIETDPAGSQHVRKFERDGSGLITGLREAEGLIEIPEETTSVDIGEPVTFLPFSALLA